MDPSKAQARMRQAIEAAKRSKAEDGRPHPCVGAVLADLDGNPLLEMARGEFEPGVHAEAGLLMRARKEGIDLTKTALFATLEPCTWRSRKHVPCALQVEDAGIPLVYIGMIDPDLRICGRGETYLSFFTQVERFPANLRMEIVSLNERFLAAKRSALVWAVKTYGIEPALPAAQRPRLSILHLSQDLIMEREGDVWISGGDLSWMRELQPVLLRAHLDRRAVRILCNRRIPAAVEAAALGVGAALSNARNPWPLRATIVAPGTDQAQILVIDAGDTHKLGWPEDQKLIETICQAFEERWGDAREGRCVIRPLHTELLIDALAKYVPQYSSARLEFRNVSVDGLRPLPASLEEFKLARWDLLSRTIERHNLPDAFAIEGSPWLCTPPVVEVYPDGMHVIIDGAHRVYANRGRGRTTIPAIVVHMPNYDLFPAIPRAGWEEVSRSYEKTRREERYNTYRPEQFRPIRVAFGRAMQVEMGDPLTG
jgi:pyrimidine deaminase RibD-like protein